MRVDAKPAQKALECTGVWEESPGKTPTGAAYTVSKCTANDAQVHLSAGKVFAVGSKVESGLDNRKASAVFKEMKKGLVAAKCKSKTVGNCSSVAATGRPPFCCATGTRRVTARASRCSTAWRINCSR